MFNEVELLGMVIDTKQIGENDVRVVLLTAQEGKVSAFARGARRQNSPLLATTNTFAFGKFYLRPGKNSYYIDRFEAINYFKELREDFINAYYGMYFLDYASYMTVEGNEAKEELSLLYLALRALIKNVIPKELIRAIYELKFLVINGVYPEMNECIVCKKPTSYSLYDKEKRGIICKACAQDYEKNSNCIKLGATTAYTVRFIISTPVEKLFTFKIKEDSLQELMDFVNIWKSNYIKKQFKSLEILQDMLKLS